MQTISLVSAAKAVALMLALGAAAGCGSSGPPRAAIHGRVLAGGQPLPAGRILFTPTGRSAGPATTARITSGEYHLSTQDGPVVGTNLVQIEADLNLGFELDDEAAFARRGGAPLPPNPIPPDYGTHSKQVVEVQAGTDNSFDVTIPQTQQVVSHSY